MVELKLSGNDGNSSPTQLRSEKQLQEVREKVEEILGSDDEDHSEKMSRMNPKQ